MVNLSFVAVTLSVASLAAAHSGVRADGGPAHMKMLKRNNDLTSGGGKLHKRCSGHSTHRSRKAYKSRASTSASATSTGDSANTTKAVQVKAAVKKHDSSDDKEKTSSSAKVFSTAAPKTTTTTSAKASSTSSSSSSSSSDAGDYDDDDASGKGLFGVSDDTCGDSGATETPSNDGGPNGKQSWLNCGITSGGWTPPSIKLSQLKVLSLDAATSMDNSVFSACAPYTKHFDKIGAQYNIPPILLAAIAMQESSCNPSVSGDNGGAFGLMQITEDKCGDAPGGDCNDVDFNIAKGAEYFASTLSDNNDDFLMAIGAYNGWYSGMTTGAAMKIRTSCWDCQQNLDYMQQMLNGWLLGLDGSKLGNVRNLDQ